MLGLCLAVCQKFVFLCTFFCHLSVKTFLPPATKLGQGYVFTGVCDSVHRGACLPQHILGCNPPGADPPEADTPQEQTPPKADIPRSRPPRADTPPRKACWEIRSMRGWYASYWNALLLILMRLNIIVEYRQLIARNSA